MARPHPHRPYRCLIALSETGQATEAEAPTRIPLMVVGEWAEGPNGRPLEITAAMLGEVKANFESLAHKQIPIDLQHYSTEPTERVPDPLATRAMGWVTALSIDGDTLWGEVDWTDEGAQLVASKAFRYISPTFYTQSDDPRTKQPRGAYLIAAALTNTPFLDMPALAARLGFRGAVAASGRWLSSEEAAELLPDDLRALPAEVAAEAVYVLQALADMDLIDDLGGIDGVAPMLRQRIERSWKQDADGAWVRYVAADAPTTDDEIAPADEPDETDTALRGETLTPAASAGTQESIMTDKEIHALSERAVKAEADVQALTDRAAKAEKLAETKDAELMALREQKTQLAAEVTALREHVIAAKREHYLDRHSNADWESWGQALAEKAGIDVWEATVKPMPKKDWAPKPAPGSGAEPPAPPASLSEAAIALRAARPELSMGDALQAAAADHPDLVMADVLGFTPDPQTGPKPVVIDYGA